MHDKQSHATVSNNYNYWPAYDIHARSKKKKKKNKDLGQLSPCMDLEVH